MKSVKRHVLIVGGSSDIGIEVVKSFLNLNWNVSAHYSKSNKKLKIIKQKSKNLKLIQFNFFNYNSSRIEYLIKKKFNNKYDSIVNLIGYIDNKSFKNTNLKSILKSLTINAVIPILINKLLVQKMLKQKFGRILNCSSIGVKFGGGSQTYNYTLAKHCLEFIPGVYKEWAKKNVLINNLRIGITNTKIHKRIKNKNMKKRINLIPIKRMAEPKEISNYIVNLVSDENSYMAGQTISISGGE